MRVRIFFLLLLTSVFVISSLGMAIAQFFQLPQLPPPEQYGNILINRTSEKNNVKPVVFSHWRHRLYHTCQVCHGEIGFEMKKNSTEITEKANQGGKFCGACHDGKTDHGGKTAFDIRNKENCDKCHNGDISYDSKEFVILKDFPKNRFGNRVNWVKAVSTGLIKPRNYLATERGGMNFDKTLTIEAKMRGIPYAVFPHKGHIMWLDCSNCHPDVYGMEKTDIRTPKRLMLEGKFCGLCHLTVAFPLDDCKACHPKIS